MSKGERREEEGEGQKDADVTSRARKHDDGCLIAFVKRICTHA